MNITRMVGRQPYLFISPGIRFPVRMRGGEIELILKNGHLGGQHSVANEQLVLNRTTFLRK